MLFLISAVALSTEFAGKFNKSIGARLGFCSGDSKQLNWSHKKEILVRGKHVNSKNVLEVIVHVWLKAKANEQYQPYQNLIIELKFCTGCAALYMFQCVVVYMSCASLMGCMLETSQPNLRVCRLFHQC
jgi:hypothetical protein